MSNSHEGTRNDASGITVNPDDVFILRTPAAAAGKNGRQLPERYVIKTSGSEHVLICLEAPNLSVHIESGRIFTGSAAHKSPAGTIFLDGVAQCEPFMDHERQVYNLDHHEGCVRAFTLSSCEQALVMYMKGLDLQSREWNIFANEPDLDTLLAIWILLNHARIERLDADRRRIIFALVRFEGAIDALGLEFKELCGLPVELLKKMQSFVDHLRSTEISFKKQGIWLAADYLAYSAEILHGIDKIIYIASDFEDFHGVHELARADLTEHRIAAVVEADSGIYELEPHLNKIYGSRLGVVFLKKGDNAYTVRQLDLFMPFTLEAVYDKLNFHDPAVRYNPYSQKWGGAADIGGAPRDSGTLMTPEEIVQRSSEAAHKPGFLRQTYNFASIAIILGVITLCAQIAGQIWYPGAWFPGINLHHFWSNPELCRIAVLLTAGAVSLFVYARRRPWQYGLSVPAGKSWWLLLPFVLAGGMIGGVRLPATLTPDAGWVEVIAMYVVGMPLAVELLFRSLGHGRMAQIAMIQRCDSRWFISWPNLGGALLYAAFMLVFYEGIPEVGTGRLLQYIAGAMVLGLSLGMVRERARSVWPAAVFHMLAVITVL